MTTMAGMSARHPRSAANGQVVVGIDDSPAGLAALRWAIGLARSRGARLVAVRAWALGLPRHGGRRHRGGRSPVVLTFRGTEPSTAARILARRALSDAAGNVPHDLDVTIQTPEGDPGLVLTRIASGRDDVLVVGSRPGPSLRRAVHGSVSAYCTAHARCPVTVVRPGRTAVSASTPGSTAKAPASQAQEPQASGGPPLRASRAPATTQASGAGRRAGR
jgi:nucleotide-binding universal stress UspA family protein